jgi:hypothetical protein
VTAVFSVRKKEHLQNIQICVLGVRHKEHLGSVEPLPGGWLGAKKETAVHHGEPICDGNYEFVTCQQLFYLFSASI